MLNSKNIALLLGATFMLVAGLGFATSGNMLLGIVHINEADRWLHEQGNGVIRL